jgi:hypothetical protein
VISNPELGMAGSVTAGSSAIRVRREKAVVHSGSNPPGNWFAPPGSNQSSS